VTARVEMRRSTPTHHFVEEEPSFNQMKLVIFLKSRESLFTIMLIIITYFLLAPSQLHFRIFPISVTLAVAFPHGGPALSCLPQPQQPGQGFR